MMGDKYDWEKAWEKPEQAVVIPLPPPQAVNGATPYGAKALQEELYILANTTPDSHKRNDQLNKSAFALATLVAAGHLDSVSTQQQLRATALMIGLTVSETDGTLRSAFNAGTKQPRQVHELEVNYHVEEITVIQRDPETGEVINPSKAAEDRTSWWPQPLADRAAQANEQPDPAHLTRDDNKNLFYAGKVNGFIGESESGKSWLALLAATQAIHQGQTVLILDFEDSPGSADSRLQTLGCTPEQRSLVKYANPEESFIGQAKADLEESLADRYTIIIIDGVNAAMTLLGYDINSNTDATLFTTKFLRPLAHTGACVITVDHVPKNPDTRGKGGIGAQAKRSMQDGTCILVEVMEPFGKGQSGVLKLTIDKDRHGAARGISGGGKNAGKAHLVSISNQVRIHIEAPDLRPPNERDWQPTGVMEQCSKLLEDVGGQLSFRAIKDAVSSREETIKQALKALRDGGYIDIASGPNRSLLHSHKMPFRENPPVSPGVSQVSPGDGKVSVETGVSRLPSPYGRETPDGDTHGDHGDTEKPRVSPGDTQMPIGHSSCNRCGEPAPDSTIEETAGYCTPCGRIMNP
jgi:hypothetical protein